MGFVDSLEFIDRLELNHHDTAHQEIQAIRIGDEQFLLMDRAPFLLFEDNVPQVKFMGKGALVRRLEEPGSQDPVDFNGRPNDLLGQLIHRRIDLGELCVISVSSVVHSDR